MYDDSPFPQIIAQKEYPSLLTPVVLNKGGHWEEKSRVIVFLSTAVNNFRKLYAYFCHI